MIIFTWKTCKTCKPIYNLSIVLLFNSKNLDFKICVLLDARKIWHVSKITILYYMYISVHSKQDHRPPPPPPPPPPHTLGIFWHPVQLRIDGSWKNRSPPHVVFGWQWDVNHAIILFSLTVVFPIYFNFRTKASYGEKKEKFVYALSLVFVQCVVNALFAEAGK